MFQLTVVHNEDLVLDLGEYLESINRHGLEVIHQNLNEIYQETTLVIQGTKQNFLNWNIETTEGDWGCDLDEFLEELTPV